MILKTGAKNKVPVELEKGDLPLNTFNNKKPFKGTIVSVDRIVGPKATGETCHIVIETRGEIPYWEGQSYGVIPPVPSFIPLVCLLSAHKRTLDGHGQCISTHEYT